MSKFPTHIHTDIYTYVVDTYADIIVYEEKRNDKKDAFHYTKLLLLLISFCLPLSLSHCHRLQMRAKQNLSINVCY